ncbi:MAG: Hsp70 family protein [Planctomycetes bacterium]|nr:Hsp70 family protein [Planctomycetota bacterium]
MARVAVDFGTGNTVLARFNETTRQTETLEIPEITTEFRYRVRPDKPDRVVHVVPSLIHYSETETLIGDQVLSRGLAEHRDTFRFMKRGIAQGSTKRKRTAQGHKSPEEAGQDFLHTLLTGISDRLSFAQDEFTFTAPTEAFEHFEDWLRLACERVGIQRLRLLDEPTACVLGYEGAARKDDRFLVFDFGCGTLDVAAVRIDLGAKENKKAQQLSRAGCDLGGLDIDHWLAEDFCRRHELADAERRELEAPILRQAEAAKIALSDLTRTEADLQVLHRRGGRPRLLKTTYRRSCRACDPKHEDSQPPPDDGCLRCLLETNGFLTQARETLDRAMENAAVKAGLRRDDITKVLVTGGTSLVPCVRRLLVERFGDRAVLQRPFDAVARGACPEREVDFILQHDYSLKGYNPERRDHEFKPLFTIGTEYPTPRDGVRKAIGGTADGQTRCGLLIYEVSGMTRRSGPMRLGLGGEILQDDADQQADGQFVHVPLNQDNPTFIVADPPIAAQRDKRRFLCSFWVDGHRRLLVTVLDTLTGNTLLKDHPVVRL